MLRFLVLIAVLLAAPAFAHDDRFPARITSVYDGDTMTATIDLGLGVVLPGQVLRLDCVDTPELRGPERPEGLAVRDLVRGWVSGRAAILHIRGKGKYGRWLADVVPEGWRESVSDRLLREGLAVVPSYAEGCE